MSIEQETQCAHHPPSGTCNCGVRISTRRPEECWACRNPICCVCLERIRSTDNRVNLTCQHVLHQDCCRALARAKAVLCPLCRSPTLPYYDNQDEDEVFVPTNSNHGETTQERRERRPRSASETARELIREIAAESRSDGEE